MLFILQSMILTSSKLADKDGQEAGKGGGKQKKKNPKLQKRKSM